MPTAIDTTKEIQDKLFAGIEDGQKAVVDIARSWAETVETVVAKLPELSLAEAPKPGQVLDYTVALTERIWSTNRDFATKLLEAFQPVTRAATTQAGKATPKP